MRGRVRLNPKRSSSTNVCQAENGSDSERATRRRGSPRKSTNRCAPVSTAAAIAPVEPRQDAGEEDDEGEGGPERALDEREAAVREGVGAALLGRRLVEPAGELRRDPAGPADVLQVDEQQRGLERVLQAEAREEDGEDEPVHEDPSYAHAAGGTPGIPPLAGERGRRAHGARALARARGSRSRTRSRRAARRSARCSGSRAGSTSAASSPTPRPSRVRRAGFPGALVIAPGAGLVPPAVLVRAEDLRAFAMVPGGRGRAALPRAARARCADARGVARSARRGRAARLRGERQVRDPAPRRLRAATPLPVRVRRAGRSLPRRAHAAGGPRGGRARVRSRRGRDPAWPPSAAAAAPAHALEGTSLTSCACRRADAPEER